MALSCWPLDKAFLVGNTKLDSDLGSFAYSICKGEVIKRDSLFTCVH